MTAQSWIFGTLGSLSLLLIVICWVVDFWHKANRTPKNIVTAAAVSVLLATYAGIAFMVAAQ